MIIVLIIAGVFFGIGMISLGIRAAQGQARFDQRVANDAADRIVRGLKDS